MANVLLVRSATKCALSAQYLEQRGIKVVPWPLQAIELLSPPNALVANSLKQADLVIAVSSNAVQQLKNYQSYIKPDVPAIAVGNATAKALRHFYKNTSVPNTHNSEGIVGLYQQEFGSIVNVLILKGRAGRNYLQQTLAQLGANVRTLSLYQRRQVPVESLAKANWQLLTHIVVTSGELLTLLLPLVPAAAKQRLTWLVIGERVAKLAKQSGITKIEICGTSDPSIYSALNRSMRKAHGGAIRTGQEPNRQ